jgi:hypothetical protein
MMAIEVVAHFELNEEASQAPRLLRRKERGGSRGSLRSFAAQKRLAQDDNFKLSRYPYRIPQVDIEPA